MMLYEQVQRLTFYVICLIAILAIVTFFIAVHVYHKAVENERSLSFEPVIIEKYYLITPETFTILNYIVGGDTAEIFHHDGDSAPIMIKAVMSD